MKLKKLTIRNIGLHGSTEVVIDKPLMIFYGEVRAGKSTILNAVRWALGGQWPQDIIQHGKREAEVCLEFDGGSVSRQWYVAKDGTTKARPVVFVRGGVPVPRPSEEITKFLNPFLLDQDHLRNMGEADRKRYFVDLFQASDPKAEADLAANQSVAQQLRIKIKSYGDIDLSPVGPSNLAEAKTELATARAKNNAADALWRGAVATAREEFQSKLAGWDRANEAVRSHNRKVEQTRETMEMIDEEIEQLREKIKQLESRKAGGIHWMQQNAFMDSPARPVEVSPPAPTMMDTTALEEAVAVASANAVRAEQLERNISKDAERKADEKRLFKLEEEGRELRAGRVARLKEISNSCGVDGLTFDDEGGFSFEGTAAGMLSTSQLMRLSAALSSLYPDGFGVDLVDRGESLGKSIMGLVDRARREEKTILATVVGERPAEVPEDVGVFVVEGGKVCP